MNLKFLIILLIYLINNIINFIKNKNNFDSLKKLESEFYDNHYKIVPLKNIKNKIMKFLLIMKFIK